MMFAAALVLVAAMAQAGPAAAWRDLLQEAPPPAPDMMSAPAPEAGGINDVDILNFALQLEYLEGEFYQYAAFGRALPAQLRGGGPPSIGGRKAALSPALQKIAEEIATDEANHVAFLRTALGSAATPIPLLDIGPAFAAAANAALNTTLSPPFLPYRDDVLFLHGAFIFEDVGVTAYSGAAPLIMNKTYLGAAAGILAVESYHAGIIRTKLSEIAGDTVPPYGAVVASIVQAISNLRATLSGAADDQGIVTPPNGVNLVPTDANSIAFARTPRQVLNIVYFAPNATEGGFFPNGLNGSIK